MSVELLQTLSLVSYILAAVFLLVSISLFFILEIPKLYGDVSGRTAKKAIEQMRLNNESTGNKAYQPSKVNAERGRLTDKITHSGRIVSATSGMPIGAGTEKISTNILMGQSNETTLLDDGSSETTLLYEPANETTILTTELPAANETTILVQEEPSENIQNTATKFEVLVEMSFTDSSEIIN